MPKITKWCPRCTLGIRWYSLGIPTNSQGAPLWRTLGNATNSLGIPKESVAFPRATLAHVSPVKLDSRFGTIVARSCRNDCLILLLSHPRGSAGSVKNVDAQCRMHPRDSLVFLRDANEFPGCATLAHPGECNEFLRGSKGMRQCF